MIKQLLTRRIASDKLVTRISQSACFAAACLIPVLVFRKFATLELSEVHLLLGVLSTMSMSALFVVAGVLLELKLGVAAAAVNMDNKATQRPF